MTEEMKEFLETWRRESVSQLRAKIHSLRIETIWGWDPRGTPVEKGLSLPPPDVVPNDYEVVVGDYAEKWKQARDLAHRIFIVPKRNLIRAADKLFDQTVAIYSVEHVQEWVQDIVPARPLGSMCVSNVRSSHRHLDGQYYRSSDDFSTEGCPHGHKFRFHCNTPGVVFDVMINVAGGWSDWVRYQHFTEGTEDWGHIGPKLYIANPQHAKDDFYVSIEII